MAKMRFSSHLLNDEVTMHGYRVQISAKCKTILIVVGICFPNRRGKRGRGERERESTREQMSKMARPPPSPWALFMGRWRGLFTFYSIGEVRYYK
jgi:hypothetical protein